MRPSTWRGVVRVFFRNANGIPLKTRFVQFTDSGLHVFVFFEFYDALSTLNVRKTNITYGTEKIFKIEPCAIWRDIRDDNAVF